MYKFLVLVAKEKTIFANDVFSFFQTGNIVIFYESR